ncbi:MAG: hypothetical protein H0V66_10940 [Bdellovibrionales bacterium]|nr:hypothetical protein [Bdellovibrionales bacterium]
MKDKRCFICKYQGKTTVETSSNVIYGNRDKSLTIPLCYTHSIELFKMGQSNFMLKYKPNFTSYHGLEEDQQIISYF